MHPKKLRLGCDGDEPGDSSAMNPETPSSASPAPEPSAEPEPAPEQAPAAGQGEGHGSPSVSGPPAGACPASEAGSEAGAQCALAFPRVQGSAQSVPSNSDPPRARFILQGPLGPRATGLGTEKAADIWKTPAASIDQLPGISGAECATFIQEPEEALCPEQPGSVKKVTQEDVKVMLSLLEERRQDLNTAARIGQSLAQQNSVLMEENSKLEAMLDSAKEEILHLRHQVSLRDDLLQLYSDSDEEEEEEVEREEEEKQQHNDPYEDPELTPLTESEWHHHCPQMDALQEQLRMLEEENEQLRVEAAELEALEEEEMFILESVEQFAEASQQMAEMSEVLALRMDKYDQHQKEVTQLRIQVANLRQRCQLYGAETKKLLDHLALEKKAQVELQRELQELRKKCRECEGTRPEDPEEKALRQQAPLSMGSVTHYTYTLPLETLSEYQESLAEELRTSLRRIISDSDPVFFMERNHGINSKETLNLGCELQCREEQDQEPGREAEEGSLWAEVFSPLEVLIPDEELGSEEELRVIGTVVPAKKATEEEEPVSEEAEAWEEVEPELDDKLQINKLMKGSPTLQQGQQLAKANMEGGMVEQQPHVQTEDFPRLEDDRANHPPMAWEVEGPSGATQATGTDAFTNKDGSQTSTPGVTDSQQPAKAPQTD